MTVERLSRQAAAAIHVAVAHVEPRAIAKRRAFRFRTLIAIILATITPPAGVVLVQSARNDDPPISRQTTEDARREEARVEHQRRSEGDNESRGGLLSSDGGQGLRSAPGAHEDATDENVLLFVESPVPSADDTGNHAGGLSNKCRARPGAQIYTMTLDGEKKRPLAEGDSPRWSPDKRAIIYERARYAGPRTQGTCASEIWVMAPDGSRQRRIHASGTDPAWSPDGERIVFSQQPPDEPQSFPTIWVMDADGRNVREVRPQGDNNWPDWSPDGDRIVFSRVAWDADVLWDGEPPADELVLFDMESGIEWQLLSGRGVETPSEPAWSPDGKVIAFESDVGKGAIYTIDTDGKRLRKLTSGTDDSSPAWTADGQRLVFTRSGDIYVMKSDGTGLRRIGAGSEPDV